MTDRTIPAPTEPPSLHAPESCGAGDGQPVSAPHTCGAIAEPPQDLIDRITELHRKRDGEMRLHGSLTRSIKSQCMRVAGWNPAGTKAEIAAAKKLADSTFAAVMKGDGSTEHARAVLLICSTHLTLIDDVEAQRKASEKALIAMAKRLPVAAFVDATPGFGFLGLAQIVGEAGDLDGYANPARLWKRMGLGLISSGERQRKFADAAKAKEAGYSPRRRSVMFVLGDSMLKAKGPYRELYLSRKKYEQTKAPTLTKMAWHRRAQRYMEKRLLRELWRAWTGAPAVEAPKPH